MTRDEWRSRVDHPAGKRIPPSPESRTSEIYFAPTGEGACVYPTRAYAGDAGWDLYVSEQVEVDPGGFVDVPCGVGVSLPRGTWGLLTGRSSTLRTRGLLVHQGVIDQGYRGPLFAGVFNLGGKTQVIEAGARVAQLIVVPMHATTPVLVGEGELPAGERGDAGFGSSGA